MQAILDLHVHSAASYDGRMQPAEIVEAARRAGLSGVAICDHDTLPDLTGVQIPEGFLLIPGIEISADPGHILGLFLDMPPEIRDRSAEAVIDAIHAAGGIAVLAHPFQRTRNEAQLTPLSDRLDGVEVFNGRAARKNRDANELARAFAEKHGLAPFAGSDAHVAREIGNGVICVEADTMESAAIREALLRGGAASGKNGRHIDVAKSQMTKLKKRGAGIGAYGKWLLFACKCATEDLFRR